MVETKLVPDYSRVGKKGTPRYYEAYGVEPPMIEVVIDETEIVGPPEDPTPRQISRRQFFQYLSVIKMISEEEALEAIPGRSIPLALEDIIGGLPQKEQFNARALIVGATVFQIDNPLSDVVRVALGWTPALLRNFWQRASKI